MDPIVTPTDGDETEEDEDELPDRFDTAENEYCENDEAAGSRPKAFTANELSMACSTLTPFLDFQPAALLAKRVPGTGAKKHNDGHWGGDIVQHGTPNNYSCAPFEHAHQLISHEYKNTNSKGDIGVSIILTISVLLWIKIVIFSSSWFYHHIVMYTDLLAEEARQACGAGRWSPP